MSYRQTGYCAPFSRVFCIPDALTEITFISHLLYKEANARAIISYVFFLNLIRLDNLFKFVTKEYSFWVLRSIYVFFVLLSFSLTIHPIPLISSSLFLYSFLLSFVEIVHRKNTNCSYILLVQ